MWPVRNSLILVSSVAMASMAIAQTPDVVLRVDLNPNYTSTTGSKNRLRWFDPLGRPSTIGVGLILEPGYYVLISERLQKIPGDLDTEQLDEAYIEDPSVWRVGRQYLPFGDKNLIREAALGARYDAIIPGLNVPIRMALFDNGVQKLRGAMARVGDRVGISVASGQHLSAAGTSLGMLRDPQSSPGPGRGYKLVVGADASRNFGRFRLVGEYVGLRRSNSPLDLSQDITDIRAIFGSLDEQLMLVVGYSREWRDRVDFYRVESDLKVSKNLSLKSFVRFERGVWKDLSVGLRIRL